MKADVNKLSREARELLQQVPVDGDFIGNTKLQRRSGLGDRYWKVRKELVSGGLVVRGKGRGGSIARVLTTAEAALPETGIKTKYAVKKEVELYVPLKDWLVAQWGRDVEDGDFFDVRITGTARGKSRSSGLWSRPDVTVVQVNSYDLLPQTVLEVATFEVKKFSDAQNLASVYEAAAHSRWAHFAYLVAEVPSEDFDFPKRFLSELERFKIGLILMWRDREGWHID